MDPDEYLAKAGASLERLPSRSVSEKAGRPSRAPKRRRRPWVEPPDAQRCEVYTREGRRRCGGTVSYIASVVTATGPPGSDWWRVCHVHARWLRGGSRLFDERGFRWHLGKGSRGWVRDLKSAEANGNARLP